MKLLKSNFINDMSKLRGTLSQTWLNIQSSLFPWLSEELGPLTGKQQELVTTLEVVRIEEFIYSSRGFPGRPPQDRTAIARAFVTKTIYNMPTTRALLDRLETDSALRRIYGWERKNDVPQASDMGLRDMLNDLTTACDVGTKKNSKGYKVSWTVYKLHIDVADGGIPISAILTSAPTHDSQVAIPLAKMSKH